MIRRAELRDLPALAALARGGGLPSFDESALAKDLEHTYATVLLAANEEGRPIAFLVMFSVEEQSDLLAIAVEPESRRRGVARALLREALAEARKQGAETMHLEVRVSNHGARAFYSVEGFEELGVRLRYYSDGEDATLMRRIIR